VDPGDWNCDCTFSTLVDSAPPGSQALASFFSAPVSLLDSGKARKSTTSQTPTTTYLVQLPAGISATFLSLFIDLPVWLAVLRIKSGRAVSPRLAPLTLCFQQ